MWYTRYCSGIKSRSIKPTLHYAQIPNGFNYWTENKISYYKKQPVKIPEFCPPMRETIKHFAESFPLCGRRYSAWRKTPPDAGDLIWSCGKFPPVRGATSRMSDSFPRIGGLNKSKFRMQNRLYVV